MYHRSNLQLRRLCTFHEHTNEVWCVAFSRNGKFLATASRDEKIAIFAVPDTGAPFSTAPTVVLTGHADEISFLSWSPDDSFLLSCAEVVKLWNPKVSPPPICEAIISYFSHIPQTGACVRNCVKHTKGVEAAVWHPDGRHFFSASLEENNRGSGLLVKWVSALTRMYSYVLSSSLQVPNNMRLVSCVCRG